ncbi:pyruvate dehydrogenase (acetyl-transferring) E1 component subunit alpha [Micromonospora sp. SH-82]|uniref:pyruvate dehydrogenase (acetyl-transferring) E1 component subunit alpha n=1 Tax=Micromonospora sp. SH-82 TaxID=3132938 RepID=UPI003EBA0F81
MGPPHVQEVPAVTTTPQAARRASPRSRRPAKKTAADPAAALLPTAEPVRLLDPAGTPAASPTDHVIPEPETLRELYRRMVVGRRFDSQATALTKQGRLAVYPSARGQEACQVAPTLALRDTDWVFPTYRESMALVARGLDPVEVLTLLRGDWHCGYDPAARRTAPQCTPLATQCVHAAGVAHGETLQGRDTVAFVYIGDGATSEGDFHEGVNFAAVFKAPVVYLVQNNKYAISVPLSRQTAAPSLAYKGIGYGVPSEQVDGNDPAAVLAVLTRAVAHARAGHGPYLVEAHTYRMEAHTNADDATRYRDGAEVEQWRDRDPVVRLEAYLRSVDALDDAGVAAIAQEAEEYAAGLRERMNATPTVDPLSLFDHVYAEPTPQLVEQREQVRAELAAAEADRAGQEGRR